MRLPVLLTLLFVCPVAIAAQIPRDIGSITRKLPSLDRLMKGDRPLSSTFDDATGPQPILDRGQYQRPKPMSSLARTSTGGFVLQPGLWEGTFESYCLRAATWAPGKGDGYLFAPMKGSRAAAIRAVLESSVNHRAIPRTDIQTLLWAILSRVKVSEMPPRMQTVARTLLPAAEIRAIDNSALELVAAADRGQLFRTLPAPVRRTLEVEADLRYRLTQANYTYEEIERIAVLSGAPPDNSNAIKRGQWSRHPGRFYIRYYPNSFAETRVQVLVPDRRVVVRRDTLNRIISIEDAKGGRTETIYDDSVQPRAVPGKPRLRAFAFKMVRLTKRGADGEPETLEIPDKGYTFHQSRPRQRRGAMEALAALFQRAWAWVETPVLAQPSWERWGERIERANDAYELEEYYRERAENATTRGDAESVDELIDLDHYRDGIDAALGDLSDRLEWLIDHQERENAALEHATDVLGGLPTTSTVDDYEPGSGVATPSGGGQLVGVSGR